MADKNIAGAIVDLAIGLGASESTTAGSVAEALGILADTLAGETTAKSADVADAIAALDDLISKVPSGTKTITANGTKIDVAQYAYVTVAVE